MEFKEVLDQYMDRLGCTAKELSGVCGLSAATISRYRSGERTPGREAQPLKKLAEGIEKLALGQGISDLRYDAVLAALQESIRSDAGMDDFAVKINYLITELNINVAALAKALNYDASFISRIRAGNRMPSDIPAFARKFASYIVRNHDEREVGRLLEKRLDQPASDTGQMIRLLEEFLLDATADFPDQTASFLQKLGDFDLNEYIRSIHFDEMKVPTMPFQLHTSRRYSGVGGQKEGEIDFLKSTVLAKSKEPVFMCSDMDMADMGEDLEFSKKWMLGVALLIKRNITLNIVHNLNRPFSELMLGLEAWIPLYMSGQVMPFYLKGTNSGPYRHLLYTSGNFALFGECIKGFHDGGRYHLTNNKEDLAYYKERAESILKEACPLMEIYTAENAGQFQQFCESATAMCGNRHYISSSLPIFTLSDGMFSGLLEKNALAQDERERLQESLRRHRERIEKILSENDILHEVPFISKEEFEEHPLVLDLTEYGYCTPVAYGYDEYLEHVRECEKYAKEHERYRFESCQDFAFRNIQIRILEGKWVCISKIKSPTIHFVIHHPGLRSAIENMCIPVRDE